MACVLGVSLIEIAVQQAAAAGVQRVVVVTGHEAQRVEQELDAIARRTGAAVEARRVEDWSKPNGYSVIAGAQGLDGPFLLMMADHIFGDGLLAQFAQQELGEMNAVLAIDAPDNPLVDPDDATWVKRRKGGSIAQIGKHITDFDAVDCGAFLADQGLVRAIEQAIAKGKSGSLSDGMQELADQGRAGTLDMSGNWWIDVDDPRTHALAEAQIGTHVTAIGGAYADA